MAHPVKCSVCGKTFDRDIVPCVKTTGRRYAHASCAESLSQEAIQEQQDENAFWDYVKKIYGSGYNYILIKKQVDKFKQEYNYSFSGMFKTLYWFYTINEGNVKDCHGVGIIPYVYEEAKEYFYHLYQTKEKNKDKELRPPVTQTYTIPSPRVYRLPHLIDIDSIEGEDNDE